MDLSIPHQKDEDKPEDDFSDLFDENDDDAKTPLAWPPPMIYPGHDPDD
jgi:hypothetical protein